MSSLISEADRLQDLLGDAHDLAVFRTILRTDLSVDTRRNRLLKSLIRSKRRALIDEALPLGKKLFAEKPNALRERFGVYTEVWWNDGTHRVLPK